MLDPVQLVRRVLGLRREASEGTRRTDVHAERVTISQDGLEASRDQPPPVRGDVRWYHAVKLGDGRRRVAAPSAPGEGATTWGPSPALRTGGAPRPRAAIQAYLDLGLRPRGANPTSS